MLASWGGDGFYDSVMDNEMQRVGFDTCESYCREYCWHHGFGYCNNCAYDKERTKRRKAESENKG